MANEMQIVIDTLYSKGDLVIAKIKESKEVLPIIIEHTTETTNGCNTTAECLCSPAFCICCSLVMIACITAIALLLYYWTAVGEQRRIEKIEWDKQRENKTASLTKEREDRVYFEKKERQDNLLSLKKEYQKMVLDYLKEKKGDCDVNKDAFIATINGYIADIESSLKGDKPSVH